MLSAFITGLAGPELTEREAAVLRDTRPCGVILFARNAVDPDQLRRLTEAASGGGRRGDHRPHRPGGRARAAPAAAALADAAGGRGLRQGVSRRSAAGGSGGARRGPPDGGGPARGRHQHQLRAAGGCAGSRQPRRHRRPRLCGPRGRCGGAGRGGGGGADGRRRAARHQAHSGAWPRHRRQPLRPAHRHRRRARSWRPPISCRSASLRACPRR